MALASGNPLPCPLPLRRARGCGDYNPRVIGSLRPAPESLLGVDVGAAFTKAALFEPVEGQYRLIATGQAPTTAGTHVLHGLARACESIEQLTGRELFREGELLA